MSAVNEAELLEAVASLEHDQWVSWAKSLLRSRDDKLSQERRARWARLVVSDYMELTEEEKEHDRKWARKVIELLHASDRDDIRAVNRAFLELGGPTPKSTEVP